MFCKHCLCSLVLELTQAGDAWEMIGSMPEGRAFLGCGIVESPQGLELLVAGTFTVIYYIVMQTWARSLRPGGGGGQRSFFCQGPGDLKPFTSLNSKFLAACYHLSPQKGGNVSFMSAIWIHNYVVHNENNLSSLFKRDFFSGGVIDYTEYTETSHILNLSSLTWRFGPSLPNKMAHFGPVQYKGTMMLTGGNTTKSKQCTKYSGCLRRPFTTVFGRRR